MTEETTAVVVVQEQGVSVHEDARGWEYDTVGDNETVLSLKNEYGSLLPMEFPFHSVQQVTRVFGEEAKIMIEQAEEGKL